MSFDPKSLSKIQQIALGTGGAAILVSFFSSYVTVSGGNSLIRASYGTNAWTSYATLGMLLLLVAVALVAVRAFAAGSLPDGVPWYLVTLAAAGAGTALIILRALTVGGGGMGVSVGPGWSGWLLFILSAVFTACTMLMFKDSGEKLPELNTNDTPPSGPTA